MTYRIALGADHAGYELKEKIKTQLDKGGHFVDDFGTYSNESVDYPDYAKQVARAVQKGNRGILCCGTGIGMSIAANKFKGVRAALCHDSLTAQMSREHNDSNILIMGGRVVQNPDEVVSIVKTWLDTQFQGGRHQRRLEKIKELEENNA